MNRLFWFVVLSLVSFHLSAQRVENVSFEQVGKEIHVYYDLISGGSTASHYSVSLFLEQVGKQGRTGPLKHVRGDVGSGISPGRGKSIIWDVLSEMEKLSGEISFIVEVQVVGSGTVADIDGNTYKTVQIGDQVWMSENLRTTRYADGSSIPHVTGTTAWDALGIDDKAYCWYDNSTEHRDTYGGLYTWAGAMNGSSSSDTNPSGIQGVCPAGWHLPSDSEWKELEIYLGMSQSAADDSGWRGTDEGGKLKETGTTHWNSPNEGATNSSGFTALPGGFRHNDGSFSGLGYCAYFWTATEDNSSYAWLRGLYYINAGVYRNYYYENAGLSVRCLRDQ